MIEAAIFDLDGTLLDTLPDICESVNAMLRAFGYPALSEEAVKERIGHGARYLVERAIPAGADASSCYEWFCTHRAEHGKTRHFAGMAELIAAWKNDLRLAVITNKTQSTAERLLFRHFGEGTFDYIGGDNGNFPLKPDPAQTRYAALKLRVAPKNCLLIGDGETDAETARRAGMIGVAALWGYRTREQLAGAGARLFAETPSDLEKIRRSFSENS